MIEPALKTKILAADYTVIREFYEQNRIRLPDRKEFMQEVERTAIELHAEARSRVERERARRRAVEHVLLAYGLMKNMGDVSHNSEAAEATK